MNILRGGAGCKRLDSKAICGGLKLSNTGEGPVKKQDHRRDKCYSLNTVCLHNNSY